MKYIILIVTIFFVNIIFCQESYKIVIVDSITNQPISNVRISSNYATLTTSDEKGIAYLPNSIKSVILIKDFYFDLEIIAGKSRTIKLKPILSINLDEILIKPYIGTSVFDKIYNVYKSKRNYNMNYKIQNVSIKFTVNNSIIIDLNEFLYIGFKLNKSAKRILNTQQILYDKDFDSSVGRSVTGNQITSVVNFENSTFGIPFFHPYFKRSFPYFDELHDFFTNPKKFKNSVQEDEKNYYISYVYKDKRNKFNFKIFLVVDKATFCITNFKKNLIPSKSNICALNLVNTQKTQKFKCDSYDEEVIFKLNQFGIYDLISESLTVKYSCYESKIFNFNYQYVEEPSVPFKYDEKDLIELTDLLKSK